MFGQAGEHWSARGRNNRMASSIAVYHRGMVTSPSNAAGGLPVKWSR